MINEKGRETENKSPAQPRFPSDMTDAKFQFGYQPDSFANPHNINFNSDLEINKK